MRRRPWREGLGQALVWSVAFGGASAAGSGCGSRTLALVYGSLEAGEPEVGLTPPDAAAPDVSSFEASVDVAPPVCTKSCDDGVACTVDSCDSVTQACSHLPDDVLCPLGTSCFVDRGCDLSTFADDANELYAAVVPAGRITPLTRTLYKFDDLALDPHGHLYGVAGGVIYRMSSKESGAAVAASVNRVLNALDFGSDGTLYGAGADVVYSIGIPTGELTTIATLPTDYASSGDIAVLGHTLYITETTNSVGSDVLGVLDLSGPHAALETLGSTGFSCIWGLAAVDGSLYGFTCNGEILALDTTTGEATLLATTSQTFIGAAAR